MAGCRTTYEAFEKRHLLNRQGTLGLNISYLKGQFTKWHSWGGKYIYLILGSVFVLLQVLVANLTRRGLDLTDEGYYMNSIHWAEHYKVGISGYGDFYSIFYQILGQDFGALRELNGWLNWLLWATFSWFFASYMMRRKLWDLSWQQRILATLIGGVFSGFALQSWLNTPSYNSLAFQGVTIFAIGVLLHRLRGSVAIPVLAAGLFLSFVGKPSTTVALVVLLLILIPITSLRNFFMFVGSGAGSLGLLSLWALHIDNSIGMYVERVRHGLELSSILDAGQAIWEGDPLSRTISALSPFSGLEIWSLSLIFFGAIGLSLALVSASKMLSGYKRTYRWLTLVGLTVFTTSTGGILVFRGKESVHQLSIVVLLSVVVLSIWILSQKERKFTFTNQTNTWFPDWSLALALALLPLAYAFGTNNNYWASASSMGGMFVTSALLIAARVLGRTPGGTNAVYSTSLIGTLSSLMVVTVIVAGAALHPYRQDKSVLRFEESGLMPGVFVSSSIENYLRQLRGFSERSEIGPSTPIFDNTGASPTALFFLGGIPLGSAWIGGGYPGSKRLAKELLSLYSNECLISAWVLDAPEGAQRIFSLEQGGLTELEIAYKPVLNLTHPLNGEKQVLYRPLAPKTNTAESCAQVSSR